MNGVRFALMLASLVASGAFAQPNWEMRPGGKAAIGYHRAVLGAAPPATTWIFALGGLLALRGRLGSAEGELTWSPQPTFLAENSRRNFLVLQDLRGQLRVGLGGGLVGHLAGGWSRSLFTLGAEAVGIAPQEVLTLSGAASYELSERMGAVVRGRYLQLRSLESSNDGPALVREVAIEERLVLRALLKSSLYLALDQRLLLDRPRRVTRLGAVAGFEGQLTSKLRLVSSAGLAARIDGAATELFPVGEVRLSLDLGARTRLSALAARVGEERSVGAGHLIIERVALEAGHRLIAGLELVVLAEAARLEHRPQQKSDAQLRAEGALRFQLTPRVQLELSARWRRQWGAEPSRTVRESALFSSLVLHPSS